MRITSRLAVGFLILTLVMVGAIGYQLAIVQSVQDINRELSETKLDAARISVRLLQAFEGVREFSQKYAVSGFEEYLNEWDEYEATVAEELARLNAVELQADLAAQRSLILAGWEFYLERSAPLRPEPGQEPEADPGETAEAPSAPPGLEELPLLVPLTQERLALLNEVESRLLRLRERTDELIAMNEREAANLAAMSAESVDRARSIAWTSAGLTFFLALLAWLFLYLSISDPLRRLTRGTRELARGRFEHRLPDGGRTEFSELATDFNEMARKLGELKELKQDFVSHVSHELKGPLAAIQETILIFLEEIPGPVTDRQRHLLDLSSESAQRLSTMIENLLEASRLEAGAREYDPVPHALREIVESVLAESEPVAEDRALRLNLTVRCADTGLLCDGDRIREVVSNLVGNALKFSPRDGRIRVTIGRCEAPPGSVPETWKEQLSRESGPFLLVSVEDDGPGVPDGHKEAIFEKFHQVDPGRRIQGQGVGLGLAISKSAVEAHGGAIWVEDRKKGGSVFRVLLPVLPDRWAGLGLEHQQRGEVRDPEGSSPAAYEREVPHPGRDGAAGARAARSDRKGRTLTP